MTGRGFATELAGLTGLAVLMALLGPFGTVSLRWPLRLLDWLAFILGGALFFRPVIGAACLVARHGALRLPAAMLCSCLLAAFPTTLLVAWCLAGMGWRQVRLESLLWLYPDVLLVGGLATALQFAIAGRRAAGRIDGEGSSAPTATPRHGSQEPPPAAPEPHAPEPPAPTGAVAGQAAGFLRRLPPALGRDLICLQNEDHYVRAHTSRGSTLLLMRLGDAVAELGETEGLRTHRSWWVARDAVDRIVRRDRSIGLVLRNGVEAPVARAMVPVLRQAGWLSDADGADAAGRDGKRPGPGTDAPPA